MITRVPLYVMWACVFPGNECFRQGEFQNAVIYYSRAIAADPNDARLFSNRSGTFCILKMLGRALNDALVRGGRGGCHVACCALIAVRTRLRAPFVCALESYLCEALCVCACDCAFRPVGVLVMCQDVRMCVVCVLPLPRKPLNSTRGGPRDTSALVPHSSTSASSWKRWIT